MEVSLVTKTMHRHPSESRPQQKCFHRDSSLEVHPSRVVAKSTPKPVAKPHHTLVAKYLVLAIGKLYMILSRNISRMSDHTCVSVNYNNNLVFSNLGVMLQGKTKYLTNISVIIEHGGGQVFRTLQKLIQSLEAGKVSTAVVVCDEESCASRHLKQCASEKNIPMTSIHWIIKSLYAGKLIPIHEKRNSHRLPAIQLQRQQYSMEFSQEI